GLIPVPCFRSGEPVSLGEWHELRVSRTGRLAILQVDNLAPTQAMAPGAFTQLSLPQNLYIGGVPNFDMVSPKVKVRTSFVGCIQKILAAALGGVNVDNCPHPCVTRPCGDEGRCVPEMDYFTCECAQGYRDAQCQQHAAPTMLQDIPVPRFAGDSYLHYSDPDTMRRYVCGMENIEQASLNKYKNGMVGCISDLILDTDYNVKLVQMSTAGKNIKHCG
ncbi:hypothetical protein ANN_09029, partial [Periplaneta americana]